MQGHPEPLPRVLTASPGVFAGVQLFAGAAGSSAAFYSCGTNDSVNTSELQREFLAAADAPMRRVKVVRSPSSAAAPVGRGHLRSQGTKLALDGNLSSPPDAKLRNQGETLERKKWKHFIADSIVAGFGKMFLLEVSCFVFLLFFTAPNWLFFFFLN